GGNRCGQKDALYGQERRPVHRFAARPAAAGRGKSLAICEIPPGSAGGYHPRPPPATLPFRTGGRVKKGGNPGTALLSYPYQPEIPADGSDRRRNLRPLLSLYPP